MASSRRCTNRSLKGNYAGLIQGTVVGLGPVAAIGVIIFDGAGNLTLTDRPSFNGKIFPRFARGTYKVNQDCNASATVTFETGTPGQVATFALIVLHGGEEFLLESTDDGAIVFGTFRKQF